MCALLFIISCLVSSDLSMLSQRLPLCSKVASLPAGALNIEGKILFSALVSFISVTWLYFVNTPFLWNQIPYEILSKSSPLAFKLQLRLLLLSN